MNPWVQRSDTPWPISLYPAGGSPKAPSIDLLEKASKLDTLLPKKSRLLKRILSGHYQLRPIAQISDHSALQPNYQSSAIYSDACSDSQPAGQHATAGRKASSEAKDVVVRTVLPTVPAQPVLSAADGAAG